MIITYIIAYLKVHPDFTSWGAYYGETQVEEVASMLNERMGDFYFDWLDRNDPHASVKWEFFPDENRWHRVFAHYDPMPDELRWSKVNVCSQEEYNELERMANEDFEWERQMALQDEKVYRFDSGFELTLHYGRWVDPEHTDGCVARDENYRIIGLLPVNMGYPTGEPVIPIPAAQRYYMNLKEWIENNPGDAVDEGPVEGVDSHAYYGPYTTVTNFIEAQRDREFD